MKKISEAIAKEFEYFKLDLKDNKGEVLDVKNPNHRRILHNIVAHEKAYRRRFAEQ